MCGIVVSRTQNTQLSHSSTVHHSVTSPAASASILHRAGQSLHRPILPRRVLDLCGFFVICAHAPASQLLSCSAPGGMGSVLFATPEGFHENYFLWFKPPR